VLIPEDGYWHSTTFSPYMHKCILAKACYRENRADELIGFYNDSVTIMRKIAEFNVSAGNNLESYKSATTITREFSVDLAILTLLVHQTESAKNASILFYGLGF